jgi:hypothetical protein
MPLRSLTLAVLCAATLATGCAQLRMGAPIPSIENIQKARAAGIAPVSLGAFKPAPGKDAAMDQRVVVRTNTIFSPFDNSFAAYLRETLATDLRAAGLLDPASRIVISGTLTESVLDAPSGPARGVVAARFTVERNGVVAYARELRAEAAWTAGFIGVEAIPTAMNQYGLLYRSLVTQLLDDPAFRAAAAR